MPERIYPQIQSKSYHPSDLVQPQAFVPYVDTLNKYDVGLREGMNQSFNRGSNQTWYQQLGNAGLRFIPSVAAKLGESTVSTVALLSEWAKSASSTHDFDWGKAMSDPMALAFSDWEKRVEQKNPIYASQKYLEGNLADKLWTSSFWTQDFADGIEFLASAYIPGAAMGKIGSVSKLASLSKLTKIQNLGKVLEGAKVALGAEEVGNLSSTLMTTALNTMSESMIEGSHLYKEVKQDLKTRFPGMSDEEIEKKASTAARNTFGYNMLYLAVPNFFQTTWLHGTSNMAKLRRLREAGKITDKELKQSIGKEFAKGFISEGLWEENIQNGVTEMEKRVAYGTNKPGDSQLKFLADGIIGMAKAVPDILSLGNIGTSAPAGSYQDEAATATLLGGLIGGPMSLWGAHRENRDIAVAKTAAVERHNRALEYVRNASNSIPDSVTPILRNFGKNDDQSTKWVDENGELQYDEDALRLRNFNHAIDKSIQQEAASATVKGDPIHLEHAIDKAITNFGWELADLSRQEDLTDDDINYLIDKRIEGIPSDKDSSLNKMSSEQVGLKGILDQRKEQVKTAIKIANKAKEKSYSADDLGSDKLKIQFNRDIARAIYYAETLNLSLNKMKSAVSPNNDKARTQLQAMIDDNTQALEYFGDTTSKSKLYEDYKREVAPFISLSEEFDKVSSDIGLQKVEEEKVKMSKTAEDLLFKLQELYAIEGSETVVGTGTKASPDSLGMFDVMTSNMFGSRQNPKAVKQPSLKHMAYWNLGQGRLLEEKLSNAWEEFNGTPTPDISKVTKVIDEIIARKGAVTSSKTQPIIDGIKDYYQSRIQDLEKQQALLSDDQDDIYNTLQEEIDTLNDQSETLEKKTLKLQDLESSNKSLMDATLSNDEKTFKLKFLELYNAITHAIFEGDKKPIITDQDTGELKANPDFEEEVTTIQEAIKHLTISLRNLHDNNEDGVYDDLIKQYEKYLDQLINIILPAVASKSEQRAGQQLTFEREQSKLFLEILKEPSVIEILKRAGINFDDNKIKELSVDALETKAYQHVLKLIDDVKQTTHSKELIEELHKVFLFKLKESGDNFIALGGVKGLIANILRDEAGTGSIVNAVKSTLGEIPISLEFSEKTVDIYTLYNQISNSEGGNISESQKQRIAELVNISQYKDTFEFMSILLQSKLSLKDQVEAESKLLAKENSPTFQQRHDAIWIMHWIMSPTNNENSSRFMTLRGIIGTGKTKITLNHITKVLLDIGALKQDEIIVMGHSIKTSNQLNKLIKGIENSRTWEDYAQDPTAFKDTKLIVIDEAAALSNSVYSALNKINKFIKVVLAGDASQNVVEDGPHFVYNYSLGRTIPLSVVYRTNIASLTNAATQFKDKLAPVREVQLQSNKQTVEDVKKDPSASLGVMSMSEADVLDILNLPSNRSRVLIVANSLEAQKYKALIKDPNTTIEVIDYLAVQGTEADEVYIIISPTANMANTNKSFSISNYNSAMYTSIGRAVKFAGVVLSGTSANQIHVPNMQDQADSLTKDFDNIKSSHLENINALRELFNLAPIVSKDIKPIVTEEVEEGEEEKLEDDHLVDTPDEPGEDELEGTNVDEAELIKLPANEYLLSFPINANFPSNREASDSDTLAKKNLDYSKTYIIRSKGSAEWLVVVRDKSYASTNKVVPIAVLGDSDLNGDSALGKYLKALGVNTAEPATQTIRGFATNASPSIGIILPNIENSSVTSFEQGSVMHSIQFNYGTKDNRIKSSLKIKDTVLDFTNNLFHSAMGKDNLELSKDIKDILYDKNGINWKKLRDSGLDVAVKIYNKGQIAKLPKNDTFKPKAGYPYLVISNLRWEAKNNKRTPNRPFYIELKAKKYNPDTMPSVSYMKDFMDNISNFRSAFKAIKDIFPAGIIKLNSKSKDASGKGQEGLYQRMLDFYAKHAYEIKTDTSTPDLNKIISKKNNYNTSEFKSQFVSELADLDDKVIDSVIQNLDIIVPLTYSIKTQDKIISFGTWKTSNIKGDITFTSTQKNKAFRIAISKGKTQDQAIIEAGITDEDNVRYTQVDSVQGTTSRVKEDRIIRGDGPLQLALDVIASANRHLKIAQERSRVNEKQERFVYHGAKNVFSNLEKGAAYQGALREWLTKDIGALLYDVANRVFNQVGVQKAFELFNEDLPSSLFSRSDFYEELPDGTTFDDRVRVRYKDNKITFAFQDSNNKNSLKPLAVFAWVNAIVGHIERANATPGALNLFAGTSLETVEAAHEWRQKMWDHYDQINKDHTATPLDESELDEILEQNTPNSKEYSNVFTPLVKSSARIPQYEGQSISQAGKLEDSNSIEMLESMLETHFQSIVPTRVSIKIPAVTTTKKTPGTPAAPQQTPQISLEQELKNLVDKPNAVEEQTTIGDMLDKISITDPNLNRIKKILLLDPNFRFLEVKQIKGWQTAYRKRYSKRRNISAYDTKSNSIWTSSLKELGNDVVLLLHEAIHAYTTAILIKPASLRTPQEQLFVEELQAIYDDFISRDQASGGELTKKIFQDTISNLDITEFVASMSNPNFYQTLSKELIEEGKIPEAVKSIWSRIWDAIVNILVSPTSKDYNLAEATFSTFEKYMVSKFQEKSTPIQGVPDAPIVDSNILVEDLNEMEKLDARFESIISRFPDYEQEMRAAWEDFISPEEKIGYLSSAERSLGIGQTQVIVTTPEEIQVLNNQSIVPPDVEVKIINGESINADDVVDTMEAANDQVLDMVIDSHVDDDELENVAKEANLDNKEEAKSLVKQNLTATIKDSKHKVTGTKLKALIKRLMQLIATLGLLFTIYVGASSYSKINTYEDTPANTFIKTTYSNKEKAFRTKNHALTSSRQCADYVHKEVIDILGEAERQHLNLYGNAWTSTSNMVNANQGVFIYNIFPSNKNTKLTSKTEINNYIIQASINHGKPNYKGIQAGDLINIFYKGSSYTVEAYQQGSSVFSTHLGIVKMDSKGNLVVEHNIHGIIKWEPLEAFFNVDPNTAAMFISAVARPNYSNSDKVLTTTTYTSNLKGAQKPLLVLQNNKAALLDIYNISSDTYDQIAKIFIGILNRESNLGTYGGIRGKYGYVRDLGAIEAGLNPSVGLGQIKISTVPSQVKDRFSINDSRDLLDNTKNIIAGMGALLNIYTYELPSDQKVNYKELLPLAYRNRDKFKNALKEGVKEDSYTKQVLSTAEKIIISVISIDLSKTQNTPVNNSSKKIKAKVEKTSFGLSSKTQFGLDSKFSPIQLSDKLKIDYYDILVNSEQEAINFLTSKEIKTTVVQDNIKLFYYSSEESPNWSRLGGSLKEAKKQMLLDIKKVQEGVETSKRLLDQYHNSKLAINNTIDSLTDQGFYKKDCI